MKIQRTIPIIIEQNPDLKQTLVAFNHVQQHLSAICYNFGEPLSALALHKKAYHQVVRDLHAQMTCTAIRLVAGAYASAKRNKRPATRTFKFKRKSALFLIGDRGRDASFHRSGKLSIWTVNKRQKIDYQIPGHFKPIFDSAISYDSITVTETNKELRANLTVTLEVPEPTSIRPVGIDLNQTNAVVAVDTKNQIFFKTGLRTRILNKKTRKTKKRLQRKLASRKAEGRDIHSIVRILKRLGKRESRRTLDFARCTAKTLCAWAGSGSVLVFENLKFQQQDRYDGRSRATHRKLSGFPYAVLRQCIGNRAQLVGISLEEVNPYNTSRICSKCGGIGIRNRHKFTCECGANLHADVNAAVNIRNRYASLRARGVLSITPEATMSVANPGPCARGN